MLNLVEVSRDVFLDQPHFRGPKCDSERDPTFRFE